MQNVSFEWKQFLLIKVIDFNVTAKDLFSSTAKSIITNLPSALQTYR